MSNKFGSVNPVLLGLALKNAQKYTMDKEAFVPAGDPAMTGADPAAGGAPPMDPAMMDPAMMGGAPPMDPAMMQPIIDQAVQAALAAQGGGAAGAGAGAGGAKAPKVDIGAELKDLKQQQAKIMDVLGITMTPSEVYSDEQPEEAAPAPEAAAGPEGTSAIQPISPMGSAFPKQGSADMGVAIDHSTTYKDSIGMQQETADKASAWLKMATAKNAS